MGRFNAKAQRAQRKNRGKVNHEKHEKHESNTENEKEEIIKDKSADHCVERKYPLTHVFDFFRVLSCFFVPFVVKKLYFSAAPTAGKCSL